MQINIYRKSKQEVVWLVIDAVLQCDFEVCQLNSQTGLLMAAKRLERNNQLMVNVLVMERTDKMVVSMTTNVFCGTATYMTVSSEGHKIAECIRNLVSEEVTVPDQESEPSFELVEAA